MPPGFCVLELKKIGSNDFVVLFHYLVLLYQHFLFVSRSCRT